MEFETFSVPEQARLIRTKEISAEELTRSVLERVSRGRINAFQTLTPETALAKARDVDRRIARGLPVGKLAGVPYSAKDVYCTEGIQTTAGSKILSGWLPPYSATVIERMNAADAVLIGKTACDEFAFGATNENCAFQPFPVNPRDPSRTPGGSSGGSAAAVAAGEGALSLGTDTGGSIREPAAFCGAVGLKPTYGRVSRYGIIAFASSMDSPGPITKTVEGAAMALGVMAGFDPRDATSARVPVPDYSDELKKDIRGLRIGISFDFMPMAQIDPEIVTRVTETARVLGSLGAVIVPEVPMPNARYGVSAYFVLSRIEAFSNLQRYDGLKYGRPCSEPETDMYALFEKSRAEGFGAEAAHRIEIGKYLSRAEFHEKYYRRALQARTLIRRDYDAVFDPKGEWRLDALLTPTVPMTALPFNSSPEKISLADRFTTPMNFAGVPALTFPAGLSSEGLPIGVQLTGNDFEEGKLLRIAAAYEKETGHERL